MHIIIIIIITIIIVININIIIDLVRMAASKKSLGLHAGPQYIYTQP